MIRITPPSDAGVIGIVVSAVIGIYVPSNVVQLAVAKDGARNWCGDGY